MPKIDVRKLTTIRINRTLMKKANLSNVFCLESSHINAKLINECTTTINRVKKTLLVISLNSPIRTVTTATKADIIKLPIKLKRKNFLNSAKSTMILKVIHCYLKIYRKQDF